MAFPSSIHTLVLSVPRDPEGRLGFGVGPIEPARVYPSVPPPATGGAWRCDVMAQAVRVKRISPHAKKAGVRLGMALARVDGEPRWRWAPPTTAP